MKRLIFFSVSLVIFCLYSVTVKADSPITSTDFYKAYMDIDVVAKAAQDGKITPEIAKFLLDSSNPLDAKAAVINALSWKFGSKNKDTFMEYLAKKEKKTSIENINILNASELLCLGYLTIMDNYFKVDRPIQILKLAEQKNKKSFTIAMILALAKAQKLMDSDVCGMWKVVASVYNNGNLTQDMRSEAVYIIWNYMAGYGDCKTKTRNNASEEDD